MREVKQEREWPNKRVELSYQLSLKLLTDLFKVDGSTGELMRVQRSSRSNDSERVKSHLLSKL